MSRLLRPPAASRATSRSRGGQRLDAGATGEDRRVDPAGAGGQLGRPLLGGDGEPGLPSRPVELGQLGGHLGGVAEHVDPLVAVDDVAEQVDVTLDAGHGAAGVGLRRADRRSGRRAPAAGRRPRPGAPSRTRSLSAPSSNRNTSSRRAARPRRGCGRGPRRGHRGTRRARPRARSRVANDVATGLSPTCVGSLQGGRGGAALAEQQVPLGDADVGPHQRGVLARPTAPRRRRRRTGGSPRGPGRCRGRSRRAPSRTTPRRPSRSPPVPARRRARAAPGPRVAAAVRQRVGLVDEVQGDAATGQPAGQVGLLGGRLAGERDRLVESPERAAGSSPWPRPARLGSAGGHVRADHVGDPQRLGRSTGAGQQRGPPGVGRRRSPRDR